MIQARLVGDEGILRAARGEERIGARSVATRSVRRDCRGACGQHRVELTQLARGVPQRVPEGVVVGGVGGEGVASGRARTGFVTRSEEGA
ncbi:MAG: hypothetical protein A2V77_21160 [Anaeromyxobacter sp. RBG_16_69_14]|nr:MAG: hypothetical protein A2V77_21160 [Anaeromyxobacter sp. RBG_16_69_14]